MINRVGIGVDMKPFQIGGGKVQPFMQAAYWNPELRAGSTRVVSGGGNFEKSGVHPHTQAGRTGEGTNISVGLTFRIERDIVAVSTQFSNLVGPYARRGEVSLRLWEEVTDEPRSKKGTDSEPVQVYGKTS